ncbi:MAG: hypothetical protein AAB676_09900 [Verrucomicrobiota bacterium]
MEALELPPTTAFWDKVFNVRVGMGYRDNVLLSHFNPEGSAFVSSRLEALFWRLPVDATEFLFFVSGDDLRYLSGGQVDKEQSLISQAKLTRYLAHGWQGGLSLDYSYQNQVIDVSATEADVAAVQLQGHGLTIRPSLKKSFEKSFYLELEGPATRQYLRQPLDDYWEAGPRLTLGRPYGQRSELALSYGWTRRWYDDRWQSATDGTRIPGTLLEFQSHETELAWRHHWDEKRRWRTVTKLGFELNEDNGSGYFDYTRRWLSQQILYQASSWELSGEVKVGRYDFEVQTVGAADSARRSKTDVTFALRGEKSLLSSLKLFAQFEHERSLSNEASYEYTLNTVSGGVDWEF